MKNCLISLYSVVAGNEMANNGDYVRAIEFFSEAINLDPSDCRYVQQANYILENLFCWHALTCIATATEHWIE